MYLYKEIFINMYTYIYISGYSVIAVAVGGLVRAYPGDPLLTMKTDSLV